MTAVMKYPEAKWSVAEEFCDKYCRWPQTNAVQLEGACESCPMERLLKLVKLP